MAEQDAAPQPEGAKPAYALPEGYDSESEFLEEARQRFQEGVDFDRDNRDAGMEDLKFLAGEQWDDAAKSARAGLPCLTINRLPQFIAQVVGDIRINRPGIKVRPAEDADKDLAEVREGLIRQIERDNDAQGVYITTGENQTACGIGNFRVSLKYATDDGFDRDIAIEVIPNPYAVVWPPLATERTGRDAPYCFVVDQIPRKEFERTWKDQMPSGLVVPQPDAQGWVTADMVRVTEYWVMKQTPVELAMLNDGSVVPADKVPQGAQVVRTRQSVRRSACLYLITSFAILAGPYELPIDRVPILRARGWEINVGDKRVRFGLVRWAKDPSRLQNYWRSVAAQTIALAPKGKWVASTAAVNEEREGDFRAAAKSTDPLLLYDQKGSPPVYVAPPPVPEALLQEAALNAQDMKDVTGLHDASLGARSNETSGRAIMARQREGDVATYVYHDNLQAAIAECGRVVNQLIPVTYDTARTIRVLGEDETVKVMRINDPNDPHSVDINKGKYDVTVEAGPSYSTRRVESSESMMQFVQAVPGAAQVAGDLIARAQDWPMADQIAERMKRAMPPQLLQGEEGAQPPPPPDPMQQAMGQMQLEGAQADLAAKKANAAIAEANAGKAQFELAHLQGIVPQMAAKMAADLLFSGPPPQDGLTPPQSFGQGPPIPDQPATGAPAA